ncbi:MAG: hypothetical protein U1E04_17465 [Hylemonella sp.]|nr:hypothetical protein [Hylemonella sp.]
MTPFEMGRISAYLLKHRKIEFRKERRGRHKDEHELAELLKDAPQESMTDLCELMNGYGFDLITLTTFDVAGIGSGERVFMLSRKPNVECPLLDLPRALERIEPAGGRTVQAKVWLTQFWLLHLDLLYTQRDRGADERNKWLDATFTKDALIEAMRVHINEGVRRLNPETLADSEVYEVLTSEKGVSIDRYAKRFLDLMVDAFMLEDKGNGVYRQTLLSAVEMKENYGSILEPLMLADREKLPSKGYAGITEPLLVEPVHGGGAAA